MNIPPFCVFYFSNYSLLPLPFKSSPFPPPSQLFSSLFPSSQSSAPPNLPFTITKNEGRLLPPAARLDGAGQQADLMPVQNPGLRDRVRRELQ